MKQIASKPQAKRLAEFYDKWFLSLQTKAGLEHFIDYLEKRIHHNQENIKIYLKHKLVGYKSLVLDKREENSIAKRTLRRAIKQKEQLFGLKKPASKGLTKLCATTVGVTGRRKKDGTQKKGYVATKGGTLKKKKSSSKKK